MGQGSGEIRRVDGEEERMQEAGKTKMLLVVEVGCVGVGWTRIWILAYKGYWNVMIGVFRQVGIRRSDL